MKTMLDRGAGILMPVSSLPSPYGIGTFGKAAYEFVDFLKKARQKYWQVLPVGPTSYGDSPYQSFSAFAGNPYFIDLDTLAEEGLLTREEIDACYWGDDVTQVAYDAVLVGSGLEIYVIALLSFVPRNGVCQHDLIRISDMRFSGCVGNGRGNIVRLLTILAHKKSSFKTKKDPSSLKDEFSLVLPL